MKQKIFLITFIISTLCHTALAQSNDSIKQKRLTLGGYGEAAMTRNFYSDHFNRYKYPDKYADDKSHGRFDLPHVVINLGYNFGKGWTMGMELEIEHGGTESAVEMDADESGEYEAEIERGGEVALEQFWINKEWSKALNLKMGELVVPVGATNAHHLPNEFFTVYRPEGESGILPCTWHQVGIELWGRTKQWGYELMFLSGLNSELFGAQSFIHYGATSPYEFKIANTYAGALRIDNYSIKGLRMSVSGYYGNSFSNTLRSLGSKYSQVKGAVAIGTFDFAYNRHNWIIRGNADYAHLSDAAEITEFNKSFPTHSGQDGSPSKHQPVASSAVAMGIEAGYNLFSQIHATRKANEKLYLFGRFEYYNSMAGGNQKSAYEWCNCKRVAVGVNYFPISNIVIKGEYSKRLLKEGFNNEPSLSLGVAYSGWFNL